MGTLSYPELEATIRLLLKKYHAEYALLFGSYARGEATPNSDIDLVVVGGPGFRARDIFALGEELRQLTRKDADVFELRELNTGTREGVRIALDKDRYRREPVPPGSAASRDLWMLCNIGRSWPAVTSRGTRFCLRFSGLHFLTVQGSCEGSAPVLVFIFRFVKRVQLFVCFLKHFLLSCYCQIPG